MRSGLVGAAVTFRIGISRPSETAEEHLRLAGYDRYRCGDLFVRESQGVLPRSKLVDLQINGLIARFPLSRL